MKRCLIKSVDGSASIDLMCKYDDVSFLSQLDNIDVLTRFNKIATQGAPQMAVDKEANSLSRVYSYYSKFNLCLFYV